MRVSGKKILQGDRAHSLHTLNLTQLNDRGLIVQEGGQLTLDSLVVPDLGQSMGDGFHFMFADIRENASISIVRSFIIHPFCPKDIYASLSEGRHRGTYHICGTRFICGERKEDQYNVDAEMQSGCRYVNLQDSLETQSDSLDADSGKDGPIKSHFVVIALVCFTVALFVIGFIAVKWSRLRKAKTTAHACFTPKDSSPSSSQSTDETDFPLSTRLIAIDDFALDLDHQLGDGGFGTVYAGRFQSRRAAVKLVKPGDMPEGIDVDAEATLSAALVHPNIAMTYGTRHVQNKQLFGSQHPQGEDECTLIFMEYCDKGDISRAIDRGEFVLNFPSSQPKTCAILTSALEIAKGLQYIHAAGIVHGDIKPDNILRKTDDLDPRGYICKICDFGLSKKVENAMTKTDTDILGMIPYMPPEMLRKGIIGKFTDVYSFGMLLWEMVTSDTPYSEVSYQQILEEAIHGRRPAIPESTPPSIARLIKACWNSDYSKRPTSMDVVQCLNCAISEWYSSFPSPTIAPIPRSSRSLMRSETTPMRSVSIHPESINSDMLDELMEEPNSGLLRTHWTCGDVLLQSDSHISPTPTSTVSDLPIPSRSRFSRARSRRAATKLWVSELKRNGIHTKQDSDLTEIRIDACSPT